MLEEPMLAAGRRMSDGRLRGRSDPELFFKTVEAVGTARLAVDIDDHQAGVDAGGDSNIRQPLCAPSIFEPDPELLRIFACI